MPPRPASRRLLIANLLAQICFGLLAMTVCLPSMQDWGMLFGSSQATVQLSFSAYVVTYGGFQLVYGPLSDRFGRRHVLMVGLLLAGLGSVLAALAVSMEALIFARALQGAGSAAGMVVGRSTVQDLFEGAERTRVMAYIGMTLGLCPPAATLIGGQLHVQWGWQANFVLMAVFSGLLLIAAWQGLPAPGPRPVRETHWLTDMGRAYARLSRELTFWLYVVLLSTSTAAFYVFLAGTPIVLASYGVGPQSIGWYIMSIPVSYIVGNFLTSHWIRSKGERRVMGLGMSASLAGLALLLVLAWAGWRHPLALALPMMLLGLGHGLLNPPALAATVGVIPALAGTAAAVAGLLQQLMGAVGGYAVGLVSHHSTVNMGLLMTGFTLLGALALWMLHRR